MRAAHTHTHAHHIIASDLMVNFQLFPSSANRLVLDHPQSAPTETLPGWDAKRLQSWTREMWEFIRTKGPPPQVLRFTILSLTLLWLTRGRATELARRLWEKDKRPAESIEIGAPVFITLVYRLNSHLFSPSAKCPPDLLLSCPHLKQFIKNEWE